MDDSFSWWTVVAASLTAQDSKLKAWTLMYSGVTSSWARYSWSTSIVSDIMMDFVVSSTTWNQW